MHTLFHIASAICFLEKATRIGAQTCYFPDGSVSYRDTPCRALSSNQASACCASSDICLDNSLCYRNGALSRGSCTDQSWQSGECAQTCRDLSTNWGALIFPNGDGSLFCCGEYNLSSNACVWSTQGSDIPFRLPDGRVVYNRTSGAVLPVSDKIAAVTVLSTSLIKSDIATVTVSATAPILTTPPSSSTTCHSSPCSSSKLTAVGVGIGAPFGLALLGALGIIWRQRSRELGARSEARAWEKRYDEIRKEKRGDSTDVERQLQELRSEARIWEKRYNEIRKEKRGDSTGVESQPQELSYGWGPNELDGNLVHEVAGRL